jgi:predicted transcriptional regulator
MDKKYSKWLKNILTGYKISITISLWIKNSQRGIVMSISIKAELARKNIRYVDVARKINMPTSTFYKKLGNNNFSINEVETIFSAIGIKIIVTG